MFTEFSLRIKAMISGFIEMHQTDKVFQNISNQGKKRTEPDSKGKNVSSRKNDTEQVDAFNMDKIDAIKE